jgi:hypothetical protein
VGAELRHEERLGGREAQRLGQADQRDEAGEEEEA